MNPIKSTAEVLAYKVLKRSYDETWIDWSHDMLEAGFDSEHLAILAGEQAPFNQFQMESLTSKVLSELHIDYSDRGKVIKSYVCHLIDRALNGEADSDKILAKLKDLYIELNYDSELYDFYSLYFAKDDLLYSENQCYWTGADRSNIDQIIISRFTNWMARFADR